ncbi:hypothetical protein CsatB_001973 [Cannabis sativa]
MAHKNIIIMSIKFLLVLSLNLGKSFGVETLQTWCIAKPSAPELTLKNNQFYACDHLDEHDCDAIEQDHPCFNTNSLMLHASFAMNLYYQRKGRHPWNCDFDKTGLVSLNNPSIGSCILTGGEISVDLSSVGKWCVANPVSNNQMLQTNIDYACSHVDCSLIKSGGACYDPTNLISHASAAMNLFYQANGKHDSGCDFMGTGVIVMTDPSYGSCKFEYRN